MAFIFLLLGSIYLQTLDRGSASFSVCEEEENKAGFGTETPGPCVSGRVGLLKATG